MKHMAFWRQGPIIIAVHDEQSPGPEEWAAYLETGRAYDVESGGKMDALRALIFTDGGGPSSAQRTQLGKLLRGRGAKTAIVTDSLLVRGIVSAVSLVNPGAQAVFVPGDWRKAVAFLGVDASRETELLKVALSLRHEVTSSRVLSRVGL